MRTSASSSRGSLLPTPRGHWWGAPTPLEGGSAHPISVLESTKNEVDESSIHCHPSQHHGTPSCLDLIHRLPPPPPENNRYRHCGHLPNATVPHRDGGKQKVLQHRGAVKENGGNAEPQLRPLPRRHATNPRLSLTQSCTRQAGRARNDARKHARAGQGRAGQDQERQVAREWHVSVWFLTNSRTWPVYFVSALTEQQRNHPAKAQRNQDGGSRVRERAKSADTFSINYRGTPAQEASHVSADCRPLGASASASASASESASESAWHKSSEFKHTRTSCQNK